MEIKHKGNDLKLNFLTRYSHKWIEPYSPYKYTRLDLQETFVVVHHVVCKDLKTQIFLAYFIYWVVGLNRI
jgi:hypothetical protein